MKLSKNDNFKYFEGKEQIQMGLDLDNTHSIMSLLRNSIYSDPISSWVRELYSNAVDAHVRAGVTTPIDVLIEPRDGGYVFVIRDYGNSMNKDTIANIYAKMGKSDKRSGNTEHGGWGLGAKSPLSYTDHFWIETWTEEQGHKTYRKWVQYIDSSRIGALSLLEEDEWLSDMEKTGTQVTIPFESKDLSAVNTALGFYLSYTDAQYNLLGDTAKDLEIGKPFYTHYGKGWAIDLTGQDSFWVSEINEGLIIVGDIPYRLDFNTLFAYFRNNSKDLLPIAQAKRPRYIDTEDRNKILYTEFLNAMSFHKFEQVVGIGTVDLNASREDLQYTDRTCRHLFSSFYDLFLQVYKFVLIDLVYHPNYPEACITYEEKYEGGFKTHFLKKVRWAKEDLAFDTNPRIFKISNNKEYCTYTLDTIRTTNNKSKNVLRRGCNKYMMTGCQRYEIIVQDTDYKNFSKFVKYYALEKDNATVYQYEYLCIHPLDLENVYDWILESTNTIKLSKLIADFKENAPATAGNTASTGTFKVLTYRAKNERSRADGITQYFDYDEVDINPDSEKYYIDKTEWHNLPKHLQDIRSDSYYYGNRTSTALTEYLQVKGIDKRDLVFTSKVTRNFKDDNWINFIDLLKEDYKKYHKEEANVVKSLFTCTYVERQQPVFFSLNKSEIARKDSHYLFLRRYYQEHVDNLKDKNEAIVFLALTNNIVRDAHQNRGGTYSHYDEGRTGWLKEHEPTCLKVLSMYQAYLAALPFLKWFDEYERRDTYELTDDNYIEYINIMEEKYNLYVTEEPQEETPKASEFRLLEQRLPSLYLPV